MSTSHHGQPASNEEKEATLRRMLDQIQGTARREYPRGRMGADDDGALSFAVAADPQTKTVIIRFGKAVEWIGLAPEDVAKLIALLSDKVREVSPDKHVHIPVG